MKEKIFIWKWSTTLYPPKEKVWVTGIPQKIRLDILDNKESVIARLDNHQCNVSYWITDNVGWKTHHTEKDNQKIVWVANGNIHQKPALTISYLKWKFDNILKWDSFVVTQNEVKWLNYDIIQEVSADMIQDIMRSKSFIDSLMNKSMWCTQEIDLQDFWNFKVISLLGNHNYIFFQFKGKYYNLEI